MSDFIKHHARDKVQDRILDLGLRPIATVVTAPIRRRLASFPLPSPTSLQQGHCKVRGAIRRRLSEGKMPWMTGVSAIR